MTNLVVGATGVVGGKICALLREQGASVRALVRSSSSPEAVERLRAAGVEIVVGDLKSPATLAGACHGVSTVFSTASAIGAPKEGDSFDSVDVGGMMHLIAASRDAGVTRIVYVSVLGVSGDFPLGRAKLECERALRESGVGYTILQPSVFMDSWLSAEMGFDYQSGTVTVFGDGTTRQGYIHSSDVARIAVSAASAAEAHNATLHLTGPDSLTSVDVVRAFEAASGRTFTTNFVPGEALAEQRAAATNPWEETFAGLMQRFAAGDPEQLQPLPGSVAPATRTVASYARELLGS